MNASIAKNEIPVAHSVRSEVGLEFLTVSCPNGWDDVKKVCGKVLQFDGRRFVYTGWNSDKNVAYFKRPLNGIEAVARIVNS